MKPAIIVEYSVPNQPTSYKIEAFKVGPNGRGPSLRTCRRRAYKRADYLQAEGFVVRVKPSTVSKAMKFF